MGSIDVKSLDSPDTVRTPDKAVINVVEVGGATVGRATFQPGWRWSESIKPVVGTEDCRIHHLGMMVSGRLHVVHSDGSEADIAAGDVYRIAPGHDAWVVGDEPAVAVEFDASAAATYAKSADSDEG